jgi:F0F1-type ATP synthase membrane subunit c/vacuolar-type H+-ATPase subunit K
MDINADTSCSCGFPAPAVNCPAGEAEAPSVDTEGLLPAAEVPSASYPDQIASAAIDVPSAEPPVDVQSVPIDVPAVSSDAPKTDPSDMSLSEAAAAAAGAGAAAGAAGAAAGAAGTVAGAAGVSAASTTPDKPKRFGLSKLFSRKSKKSTESTHFLCFSFLYFTAHHVACNVLIAVAECLVR